MKPEEVNAMTENKADSELVRIMREYDNRPGKDDLRKAYWDLCTYILYAAAATGDEDAKAFVKKHDLKFYFGPQLDIDTCRVCRGE